MNSFHYFDQDVLVCAFYEVINYYSPITGKLLHSERIPKNGNDEDNNNDEWNDGNSVCYCKNTSLNSDEFSLGNLSGDLLIANVRSNKFERLERNHGVEESINCLDALDNKFLLSGGYDVCLWNLVTKKLMKMFRGRSRFSVTGVKFIDRYTFGMSCHDFRENVKVFDSVKCKGVVSFGNDKGDSILDLCLGKEKQILLSSCSRVDQNGHGSCGLIQIYDLLSRNRVQEIKCDESLWSINASENYVFTGDYGGNLHCFDLRRSLSKMLYKSEVHAKRIYRLLNYKRSKLISGSADKTINIINASTGRVEVRVNPSEELHVGIDNINPFLLQKNGLGELSKRDFDDRVRFLAEFSFVEFKFISVMEKLKIIKFFILES